MIRKTTITAVVSLCVLGVASPSHSASTSPGKKSAFESATTFPLPPSGTPLLTATIEKGKKKTVLAVEAMMTNGPYAPAPVWMHLSAAVNGVLMEPHASPFGAAVDCGGSGLGPVVAACTVTGSWWLDMDANPALVGVPLAVTLSGGDLGGPGVGSPVDVTLSVRVEKK